MARRQHAARRPDATEPSQAAGDQRLPWERPRPQPRLSPTGCAAGFRGCVHARLAGHHAETLRALPRTTQRPLLWAGHSLSGYQEAHQQAQKKATKIAKAA